MEDLFVYCTITIWIQLTINYYLTDFSSFPFTNYATSCAIPFLFSKAHLKCYCSTDLRRERKEGEEKRQTDRKISFHLIIKSSLSPSLSVFKEMNGISLKFQLTMKLFNQQNWMLESIQWSYLIFLTSEITSLRYDATCLHVTRYKEPDLVHHLHQF